MVEPTYQNRCTGNGFKPPKGAVFKRHGIERLGKGSPRGRSGMAKGEGINPVD